MNICEECGVEVRREMDLVSVETVDGTLAMCPACADCFDTEEEDD